MRLLNLWWHIAEEWLRQGCFAAAAACVIVLSFAAGHCKAYWSGCIKAAIVICQQIFSILALGIFLLEFL